MDLSDAISEMLAKTAKTKADLNNKTSLLSIEADLANGVTSDHISTDMAAISTAICNAIADIRCQFLAEGIPPRIVGEATLNAFKAIHEIIQGIAPIFNTHGPTLEHYSHYINANLGDVNAVIQAVCSITAQCD